MKSPEIASPFCIGVRLRPATKNPAAPFDRREAQLVSNRLSRMNAPNAAIRTPPPDMKLDMLGLTSSLLRMQLQRGRACVELCGRPRAIGPECSHRYKQLRSHCCQADVDLTTQRLAHR